MFSWIKNIFENIKDLNHVVEDYKSDSIIQSLPTVACVNKAKKLIREKKFEEAETVLKKALDISEQDSMIFKYLGKIYEQRYKFEEAVNYYQKSSKLNPTDKEIWLRLGMSLLNCKKLSEAIFAFEQGDKVTPFNTDIYTGWGMALMKQKKYALARDKFQTASQISKYNYTAILLSAIMEVNLHDYDSAEMKLQFLAKVAPNESSTYEYANLKFLKSDYKEAEKFALKSIEINKQMLPAYLLLGNIYSLQKDKTKMDNIFQKAIDNGLDCALLHDIWGRGYLRFFEFEKAGEQFSISIEKDSEFIEPKLGLALVKAYNKDFLLLDELKEKNGQSSYIQEAIGLEEMSSGKIQDAIESFKKALRTEPKQTFNYYNLARSYKNMGDNYKVRENYEKFITENPDYIDGFIDYSEWLIETEDFADAQRKLRRAERLDKNNAKVLNLLFLTLYTLVKKNLCEYNIKEAISVAQKAQDLGNLQYPEQKQELENILKDIQGNK